MLRRFIFIALFIITLIQGNMPMAQDVDSIDNTYLYTYHQATGNRLVAGSGTFPMVTVQDAPLDAPVQWIIGYVDETGAAAWQTARLQPPILSASGTLDAALQTALVDTAPDTHPVPVGDAVVTVAPDGDVVLYRDGVVMNRLALNVQPDARLVVNEQGQIALYANATNQRYVHAIMGDDLEGASLIVLDIAGDALQVVEQVDLSGETIYEGLSPMWADINQDGTPDLVTTVSNSRGGAQIRAYIMQDGRIVQEVDSSAIGQGFRWRHQLAWGAFGVDGEMLLVDVRTPHIGGIVEFFRYVPQTNRLDIIASLRGYTSHIINSRNLDMAVAGDFNGDGIPELVLPTQDRTYIAGVQIAPDAPEGAREVWRLPVDGQVVSNVAALTLPDGHLALAVATNRHLRVWTSQ